MADEAFKKLQDIAVKYTRELKDEILKRHREEGQVATGKTSALMKVRRTQDGCDLIGWKYMDTYEVGRAPGRMPEIEKIKEWIVAKNLSFGKTPHQIEHYAYCIAYKIAREGTQRYKMATKPDIFTTPINKLQKKIEKMSIETLELEISELILKPNPARDA